MTTTEQINELRDKITTEWTVKITNHDYLNDSRDDVKIQDVTPGAIVMRPAKAWASQGRKFPTTIFTWDGDMEVEGTTVHVFHTPPPHTGKSRRRIKTYKFIAPQH